LDGHLKKYIFPFFSFPFCFPVMLVMITGMKQEKNKIQVALYAWPWASPEFGPCPEPGTRPILLKPKALGSTLHQSFMMGFEVH
jgi:hypothetical protein